jgi:hypothetical protein
VIATYDEANGVTSLFTDEFSSSTGTFERALKVAGTDSGLNFELDITNDAIVGGQLANNKQYYFAVTAYGYDLNNVTPYNVGGGTAGIVTEILESARNVIVASPKSSSAVLEISASAVTSGPLNLSGAVDVNQLIQNDINGHTYGVTFDDLERWTLRDKTTNTTLLADQTNIFGAYDNPVIDGFMPRVTAPRGVADFGELAADSSLLPMSAGEPDSTGTWKFQNRGDPSIYSFLYPDNHDYEIRFLPDTTQYCWLYGSGEVSFVASFKVPFEVWDLGFNSLADNSDDVKLSVMARDRNLLTPTGTPYGDGRWNWRDRIYIRKIPYADVDWDTTAGAPNPITKSVDYVPDGTDQVIGGFELRLVNTAYTTPEWPQPTTIRILDQRFTSADEYEFTTAKAGTQAGTVVGRDIKKILAVPNPYYASSAYELTQFDRVMKFTNIPASHRVTIRIFNLGGDLVRTIVREATTPDEQANATINWNLNTDHNLPVASGVYIYRVDVDGVGSKTDRIAVFVEQERLDNF